MCQFFSAISNGKGKTLFFKLEDIVNQIAIGNPKNYEWNSHTSIAHFNGIKGADEDKWNKWEYNSEKKEIKADSLVTTDDSKEVKIKIEKYLEGKNILYLQNLYNGNSGDRNSGNLNSGDWNSGNLNSREITINDIVYVPKGKEQPEMNKENYVIVRSYAAGVFAGYMTKKEGQEVTLRNARRLWYWDGAASLSQLAMEGVSKPQNCRFPCPVDEIVITKAEEIIKCSLTAIKSIEGVKEWKA